MTEKDAPKPQAIDLPSKPHPARPQNTPAFTGTAHAPAPIEMSPRDIDRARLRKAWADVNAAQDTIPLHHVGGDITQVPRTPPPAMPARRGPPAPAIGEHPHLQASLDEASNIDPAATTDPRFRSRLDKCLSLRAVDLISWGEPSLEPLRKAADTQAQIAKKIATLDAARIADECRVASTKPPSLMDRLTGSNKPAFFKQTLTTSRTMLVDVGQEIEQAETALKPKLETLRLDILALQVASKTLTDQFQQTTAAGRLRTLVSGQQMAAMALQTFDNMRGMNLKLMQDIDQLLNVVIPGWTLAQS